MSPLDHLLVSKEMVATCILSVTVPILIIWFTLDTIRFARRHSWGRMWYAVFSLFLQLLFAVYVFFLRVP